MLRLASSVVRAAVNDSRGTTGRSDPGTAQRGRRPLPHYAETHRLLGLAYWLDDQQGKSIEHLRSAIRLAPDDERARVTLADVLAGDRRFAEAERELTLAIESGRTSGRIRYRACASSTNVSRCCRRRPRAFTRARPSGPSSVAISSIVRSAVCW